MPELPEVENFRRFLDAIALHKCIERVTVLNAKILSGISSRKLSGVLTGQTLIRTHRHGKHLFAAIDSGRWLMLHFGMSGRLAYFEDLKDDPQHDRLRLDFTNGYHLAFVNQRLLGEVGIVEDPPTFVAGKNLGPDALDVELDEEAFRELLVGRRGQVKSLLMNQCIIAGIGNVYSDEILFQARIHPRTEVSSLTSKTVHKLFRAIKTVLKVATESGAGSHEFLGRLPPEYLLPRREQAAACPRCGGIIRSAKAAGRTVYYCANCQPLMRGG